MSTTVKVSTRLLTGLLGAAALAVLVFGVWPAMFGPSGLNIGRGYVPMPAPQRAPNVPVLILPGTELAARFQTAGFDAQKLFPWTDTSVGTRDAATGLPPVELTPGESWSLTLWDDLGLNRLGLAFAGPDLAAHALFLLVLWLLWRIVRTVSTGEVFTTANVRRTAGVGFAVAVGGTGVQLLGHAANRWIIDQSAAAGLVVPAFSFSFLPLVVGAVVLFLAEVFRHGVRMRTEIAGLV